jgi:hypothetical protein
MYRCFNIQNVSVLHVCFVMFWLLTVITSPDNVNLLSFLIEVVFGVR